jgi:hypothetical protein
LSKSSKAKWNFSAMAEGVVAELLADVGFADVHAVVHCAARLSQILCGKDDPGVCTSVPNGDKREGGPYSKPGAGKVKVRCAKWRDGEDCKVGAKKKAHAC